VQHCSRILLTRCLSIKTMRGRGEKKNTLRLISTTLTSNPLVFDPMKHQRKKMIMKKRFKKKTLRPVAYIHVCIYMYIYINIHVHIYDLAGPIVVPPYHQTLLMNSFQKKNPNKKMMPKRKTQRHTYMYSHVSTYMCM